MNTVLNGLINADNYKQTENGAVAMKSTHSAVLDMFALCGAYRGRSKEECISMFKDAFNEDSNLALKCLFYLGDCRGGQGERRFFRICFNWLAKNYKDIAIPLIQYIPDFRRWDDILYACADTPAEKAALEFVKAQLGEDIIAKAPSLLAKWLPSENASSYETKAMADKVRKYLGLTHKQYRKTLSILRSRINIVEKLMSEGRWDEIEFDKIPSKAGLNYRNAFATNEQTAEKYRAFMSDKTQKVNAGTLYPYEIVEKARRLGYHSTSERDAINKYWENLPDYFNGKPSNILCMVDTSGSMTWNYGVTATPMDVAISLGIYAAERLTGPFKNHYISFASRPQLIKIKGNDFCSKVQDIYRNNLCDNTNLTAAFNLLLNIAQDPFTNVEDLPDTIVVISDMEIDSGDARWTTYNACTEMEKQRAKWNACGIKMPRLVYWNVNARNNTILDKGDSVSFVSGFSPTIFKSIITGKTGYQLMLDALLDKRYDCIKNYFSRF